MHVTTLKLPKELKQRISALVERSGGSAHAWMLSALARETELAELREGFISEALEAANEIDAGGPVYTMKDVHAYLRARAKGGSDLKPSPVKARRR